jgi:hypothetical protein
MFNDRGDVVILILATAAGLFAALLIVFVALPILWLLW